MAAYTLGIPFIDLFSSSEVNGIYINKAHLNAWKLCWPNPQCFNASNCLCNPDTIQNGTECRTCDLCAFSKINSCIYFCWLFFWSNLELGFFLYNKTAACWLKKQEHINKNMKYFISFSRPQISVCWLCRAPTVFSRLPLRLIWFCGHSCQLWRTCKSLWRLYLLLLNGAWKCHLFLAFCVTLHFENVFHWNRITSPSPSLSSLQSLPATFPRNSPMPPLSNW